MKSLKIIWLVLVGYSAVVFQKVEPSQHIALDRGISPRALTEETEYLAKVLELSKGSFEVPDVITIKDDLLECEASNNGDNSSPKICVGKKDKDTSVVFYSASERSEITLSGFSLKSEEVDLKNYFESFFNHLASQALSPETKLSVVKSALQQQLQKKYENNNQSYDLNKVWNSDSFDIVFDGKQNISLKTSGLELIPPNAIRCKWDAKQLLLTFATQYFESQITLAMTSKDEIEKEVSLALTEVIDQFERIKQFMYDEPAPNNEEDKPQPEHIKHLDCAKLLNIQTNGFDPFKSLKNILGQDIKIENPEETKIEFVYNDNLFEIQCHEPNEGSQFLVLEFKIGEVEGPNDDDLGKLKQIFPLESLYDLLPIAEAFYAETAWIISQIYPSEEKSEQ